MRCGLGSDGHQLRFAFAEATVRAVMLTMRRTVADEVRMFTGAAQPSRIGPMATLLPAAVLSKLYAIFAESRFGNTSRFADPVSVVSGRARLRNASLSALSPCISPSTSKLGDCA